MSQAPRSPLQSGASSVEITPPPGTQLAGVVDRRRPARNVVDPLFARVVVYEADMRVAVIALDLILVSREWCDRLIDEVVSRFGFERQAVLVHATQTHSAPSFGPILYDEELGLPEELDWVRLFDRPYCSWVVERAVAAVGCALSKLEPVTLGARRGVEGRLAFNRRGVTRAGSVVMPQPQWVDATGPSEIAYMEGPADPELGVMVTRNGKGSVTTIVANYTCHPVHLFAEPGGKVSADWPGETCRELEEANPTACALVLNGACGDVNPWNPFEPRYDRDQVEMGKVLAAGVAGLLETLEYEETVSLAVKARTVQLPYREIPEEEIAAAEKLLHEHPLPVWYDEVEQIIQLDWVWAALKLSVQLERRREESLAYEIKVFRVGNVALVGLPGEPFAQGGLNIKLASPAELTFIVHNVSQYAGYLPLKEAVKHGGHEADFSAWSKLAPEAWGIIEKTAIEMLHELFPPASSSTALA